MADGELVLSLERRRINRYLIVIVAVVTVIHLFWWSTDHLDLPGETLWRRLANVDAENTFPTWLSAVLLAVAAALAGLAAGCERRVGGRYGRHWWFLAVILTVLSIDEIAALHEATSGPIRRALGSSGLFFYGWVVPALFVVGLLTIGYARFVADLPKPVKGRLILAAAMFVGGAVGLEMVAGLFAGTTAREGWPYFLTSTIEEILELGGLILLVDTLLFNLAARVRTVQLVLGLQPGRDAAIPGEARPR